MASGSDRTSLTRFAWLSILAALLTIGLKTGAWWLSGSVGLLSDAFESGVNLVAAVVALAALTVAVLGLIVGLFRPRLTQIAAALLSLTMLGAQYTHWVVAQDGGYAMSLVLLIVSLSVLALSARTAVRAHNPA